MGLDGFQNRLSDHPAGHPGYRRQAHVYARAWPRDLADTRPANDPHPVSRAGRRECRDANFSAVGDIRVIAPIFYHRAEHPPLPLAWAAFNPIAPVHREIHIPTNRQTDADLRNILPSQQRRYRRLGRGRSARAGSVPGPEGFSSHRLTAVIAFYHTCDCAVFTG